MLFDKMRDGLNSLSGIVNDIAMIYLELCMYKVKFKNLKVYADPNPMILHSKDELNDFIFPSNRILEYNILILCNIGIQ